MDDVGQEGGPQEKESTGLCQGWGGERGEQTVVEEEFGGVGGVEMSGDDLNQGSGEAAGVSALRDSNQVPYMRLSRDSTAIATRSQCYEQLLAGGVRIE